MDFEFNLFTIVLIIILGLIVGSIGRSKGDNFLFWFIFGMALFIVAFPLVLRLKNKNKPENFERPENAKTISEIMTNFVNLKNKIEIIKISYVDFTADTISATMEIEETENIDRRVFKCIAENKSLLVYYYFKTGRWEFAGEAEK